jgi:hypothetical protein
MLHSRETPTSTRKLVVPLLGIALLSLGAYFAFGWRVRDTPSMAEPSKTFAPPASPATHMNQPASRPVVPRTDTPEEAGALFRRFRHCYQDYLQSLYLNDAVNQCSTHPDDKGNFISCKEGMAGAQLKLNSVRDSMANCGEYADIARKYYGATKVAAKTGDQDAQMCYVQSGFQSGYVYANEEPLYTEQDVADYEADSPKYISDALARGDWRVVQILSTHFFEPSSGLMGLIDHIGEPETVYKMEKLLQLGAAAGYAKTLSYTIEGLAHPDLAPDQALPEQRIAEADAWAEQMYAQHFTRSPKLTREPVPCADDSKSTTDLAAQ